MNALIILGNQLFQDRYLNKYKNNHFIYMAEDKSLCTYVKHHKQKIYYFLASMREFRDNLIKKKFKISYSEIENSIQSKNYFDNLTSFIKKNNIKKIRIFEIEDKLFENKFIKFVEKNSISYEFLPSPMFVTGRAEFINLYKDKKPLMANFYQYQRKKLDLLMLDDKPLGGQWSFDKENRKRVPKDYEFPRLNLYTSKYYEDLSKSINKHFKSHFGTLNKESIFPFNRKDSLNSLKLFLKEKINNFGDYEDFISTTQSPINHSLLSGPLNMGIIDPIDIIDAVKDIKADNISLNNLEGFIRQIIGWREFIRGINQKHYNDMLERNFFNNTKSLTNHWYEGTTSLPILNDLIHNLDKTGYAHHIPRLMIASNIMNLSGIRPIEVYNWFMTTFIDSSDWVMVPNVFGMGLYSDGGIFSTKPYICGSNYLLKMSDYKKGPWTETLDGLYWNFIKKNENFFKKNPRLSMMTMALNKMSTAKLNTHVKNAEKFINEFTK